MTTTRITPRDILTAATTAEIQHLASVAFAALKMDGTAACDCEQRGCDECECDIFACEDTVGLNLAADVQDLDPTMDTIAIYGAADGMVLVGDAGGPWAVTLFEEGVEIDAAD